MLTFELDRLLSYDDEALLAELRRVAALVNGQFLTKTRFDQHSKVHSKTVSNRFGSWQEALAKAGLEDRSAQTRDALTAIYRIFTDDQLLAALKLVAAKVDDQPLTQELFNEHGQMNARTISQRFGGWEKALKMAGLQASKHARRYSDDEYFENLLAVWTHYGRQPKYGEMNAPPSSIPISAYEHKWHSWTKALLAFLERVNSDICEQETETFALAEAPSAPTTTRRRLVRRQATGEDQRQIRLGLRYEVLKRDRFRCVLCGASPATHLCCVLHVDHVIPWSKGGKTVAQNLRSLCKTCNLGKSDKDE